MNILVTGSNGQLGQSLRAAVSKRQTAASPAQSDRYIFTDLAQLDITDPSAIEAIMQRESIDAVINCASYTAVERAEDEPAIAEKVNSTAVLYLAEAARAHDALLIHFSTDYIFDGTATAPIPEDAAPNPLNTYAISKLHGEQAIAEIGCKSIVFRISWMFSPYAQNFCRTIFALTASKSQIRVVSDQVGSPTYAPALAAAIVQIIKERKFQLGTYNYSSQCAISWHTFAKAIAQEAGHANCTILPCTSDEYPSKARRPHYSVLDKSKFVTSFGISIPSWQESLASCVDVLKEGL